MKKWAGRVGVFLLYYLIALVGSLAVSLVTIPLAGVDLTANGIPTLLGAIALTVWHYKYRKPTPPPPGAHTSRRPWKDGDQ